MSKNSKNLSKKNYISYGIGDIYGGSSFFIIGALFLYFLTEVGGLKPILAGTIIMAGKIWDAVTDPTMGYISDRTNSKYGRRKLYFLLGIIPVAVSFFLLWVSIQSDSQLIKFFYHLITYLFFNTVFTMVMVPYNSMPAEMTEDYEERSQLNAFRMFFSQFGALLGALLPKTIINMFPNQATGYMLMGIIFGIMYALPWIAVFRGTWEKNIKITREKQPLFREVKNLISEFTSTQENRSLRVHVNMYLCAYVAMDIFNALLLYYLTYSLEKSNLYQAILGTVLLVEILSIYFVTKSCSKIGNAKTYRIHTAIWAIGILAFGLVGKGASTFLIIGLAAIIGIGLCGGVIIPYNMLSFVTDADEIISKKRREGIYAGMMTFIRKIAQAIALFMVGVFLEAIGFVSSAPKTAFTLRWLKIGIMTAPVLLIIIGIISSFKFKITPANHQILLTEIDRLKSGGNKEDVSSHTRLVCEEITGQQYNDLW